MREALANAVVFDLDGTLVDTLEDIAEALNRSLASLGCPTHELAAFRGMIGDGARLLVERALPAARVDELVEPALELFRQSYAERLVVRTRLYPGVAELLDDLAARRVPASIVSNKPEDLTAGVVRRLLGRWPFALVAGQRPGVPRKPDPSTALGAAGAMGVPASRCLFVGDSAVDMETAHAADMVAVGVSWGFRDPVELLAHGATMVVGRPAEIRPLLAPPRS